MKYAVFYIFFWLTSAHAGTGVASTTQAATTTAMPTKAVIFTTVATTTKPTTAVVSTTVAAAVTSCGTIFSLTRSWNEGWQGNVKFTVPVATTSWTMVLTFSASVTTFHVYNSAVSVIDPKVFTLTSFSWSGLISAGGSLDTQININYPADGAVPALNAVTFNGQKICTGTGEASTTQAVATIATPTTAVISTTVTTTTKPTTAVVFTTVVAAARSCGTIFSLTRSWDDGWQGNVKFTVAVATTSWTMVLTFSAPVTTLNVYNSAVSITDAKIFTLTSFSWSGSISAGESLDTQININYPSGGAVPALSSVTFNGQQICTESEPPVKPTDSPKSENVTTSENELSSSPEPQNTTFIVEDSNSNERKMSDALVLSTVIPIAVFVSLLILVVLGWFLRKRRRKYRSAKKMKPTKSDRNSESPARSLNQRSGRADVSRDESWVMGEIDSGWRNPDHIDEKWEFPRKNLKIRGLLGEGCFGQVWKSDAKDFRGAQGPTVVAVKTVKEVADDMERQELLKELHVMKLLDPHPNVVSLLGCCTDKDPVFIILEYVSGGELQSYLRKSRDEQNYGNLHGTSGHLTSHDLISFGSQAAKGMEYLSLNGIIHRDLAARNVLVEEEKKICKVADFGFARDLEDNHIYERKSDGRLPIRWLAPESLYDNIFTTKSDVWSFGVLLWEIVTLGSTPYPGLAAGEVMKRVREGYRLEKPVHCRRELYNIMFYCWDSTQTGRPTFSELVDKFDELLCADVDYIQLEQFPDNSYYNVVQSECEEKV